MKKFQNVKGTFEREREMRQKEFAESSKKESEQYPEVN
jgi:hypothetical protein